MVNYLIAKKFRGSYGIGNNAFYIDNDLMYLQVVRGTGLRRDSAKDGDRVFELKELDSKGVNDIIDQHKKRLQREQEEENYRLYLELKKKYERS